LIQDSSPGELLVACLGCSFYFRYCRLHFAPTALAVFNPDVKAGLRSDGDHFTRASARLQTSPTVTAMKLAIPILLQPTLWNDCTSISLSLLQLGIWNLYAK
jgi:hypothetical protein